MPGINLKASSVAGSFFCRCVHLLRDVDSGFLSVGVSAVCLEKQIFVYLLIRHYCETTRPWQR